MNYQLSESFCGADSTVTHATPTIERIQRVSQDRIEPAEETLVVGESRDVDCLSVPDNAWRSNCSDSDWVTTTDTSVHSSLSNSRSVGFQEVPSEVLEACAGMDDPSCSSPSPTSEVPRTRRKVSARAVARKPRKVKRKESSDSTASGSSSSRHSESASTSGSSSHDTATSSCSRSNSCSSCSHSSSCSCSSYRHSSSCSCSSCRHSSSCSCSSCSHSSCSCSHSSCSCSEKSNTSYESTDDLTDLPRAKTRARRLGKKASLKVADKCNQS